MTMMDKHRLPLLRLLRAVLLSRTSAMAHKETYTGVALPLRVAPFDDDADADVEAAVAVPNPLFLLQSTATTVTVTVTVTLLYFIM